MSNRPSWLLWLVALLVLAGCGAGETTVIVVRHAEKETGEDPGLTPAGKARAQALVERISEELGGEPLTAVYHTPYNRTRLTAEPAAEAFGVRTKVFPVVGSAEEHARDLAETVLAQEAGGRVLIVGHSNTVPLILEALGAVEPPEIGEDEYAGFYKVVVRGSGTPAFMVATYGE